VSKEINMMDLRPIADIVSDLSEWAHKNFADSNPWEPLVGMSEEIGELAYPLRYHERVDIIDALGDILIYSIDFARRVPELNWMVAYDRAMRISNELSPDIMMAHVLKSEYGFLGQLVSSHGRLSHHFLKQHQGIRITENHNVGMLRNLTSVIESIEGFSRLSILFSSDERPFSAHRLLAITAEQVLQRDWTKERDASREGRHICPCITAYEEGLVDDTCNKCRWNPPHIKTCEVANCVNGFIESAVEETRREDSNG